MNNKRLFIKMTNRTETNYTKCAREKKSLFSRSFSRLRECVLSVFCMCECVSGSDPVRGGRQKEGEAVQGS